MKKILILFIFFFSYASYSQTAEEYFGKGNKKYNKGDFNGAIADYTKAIEIDSDYEGFYINRGAAKYKLKNFSGAIADYSKAIQLDPNNGKIYYNRGFPKGMLEDYEGSCEDFNKSLELGIKFKKKDKKFIFKYCEIGDL